MVERYTYTPYGAVTVLDASGAPQAGNTSAFGWQYLFQGGRLDAVTGEVQFARRDYIPSEGRGRSGSAGLAAGDLNIYRFVGSDPIDETDPTGLGFLVQWVIIFQIMGIISPTQTRWMRICKRATGRGYYGDRGRITRDRGAGASLAGGTRSATSSLLVELLLA